MPACIVVAGRVAAALQVGLVAATPAEHVRDRSDMPGLPGVARAHQRDLRRGESKALDAAARGKRQRLQRLQRAAGERERSGVARAPDHVSLPIDDRDRAEMDAFDHTAADDFCKRRIAVGAGNRVRQGCNRARGGQNSHYRPLRPGACRRGGIG
jgi:hypothetical protein